MQCMKRIRWFSMLNAGRLTLDACCLCLLGGHCAPMTAVALARREYLTCSTTNIACWRTSAEASSVVTAQDRLLVNVHKSQQDASGNE
ncbi:hypothetical protein AOQ84DRAFT_40861 [Glonium stellatum]|uniref:Secreted protein n=1 Tax=Glonium stellatum TaxID=574774 RepID=A0A8E2JSW4_9PEZI|nr:hypothetical protein AOQ84DRAFT_40861 [Glonium stellatum]